MRLLRLSFVNVFDAGLNVALIMQFKKATKDFHYSLDHVFCRTCTHKSRYAPRTYGQSREEVRQRRVKN